MRSGQNPAKFIDDVARPEKVTVVVVTYLPFLAGYFAEGLEVLHVCLNSVRRNTDTPFDLMVFDNGSAPEVVADLLEARARGEIDYLLLSRKNLGKGGAWDIALAGAPGEILAYADGDVYFHPGWLPSAMRLLDTFPKVGMVSSRPMRTDPALFGSTLRWADSDAEVQVERGQFIPWETVREHDVNLGQPEADVRRRYEQTEDVRLRYGGAEALVGAVHWQFIGRKDVLRQFLPLSLERPMGQVRTLDARLDAVGYLRLMTPEARVRHMGNTVPPDLKAASGSMARPRRSAPSWLLRWGPVRRLLLGVHNQIFRWYFRS